MRRAHTLNLFPAATFPILPIATFIRWVLSSSFLCAFLPELSHYCSTSGCFQFRCLANHDISASLSQDRAKNPKQGSGIIKSCLRNDVARWSYVNSWLFSGQGVQECYSTSYSVFAKWEGMRKEDAYWKSYDKSTGEVSENPDDELSRQTYFQPQRVLVARAAVCSLVSNSFLLDYSLVFHLETFCRLIEHCPPFSDFRFRSTISNDM